MKKNVLFLFFCIVCIAAHAQQRHFSFDEVIHKRFPDAKRLERLINQKTPPMRRQRMKVFRPDQSLLGMTYTLREDKGRFIIDFCFCASAAKAQAVMDYYKKKNYPHTALTYTEGCIIIVQMNGSEFTQAQADELLNYFTK